MLTAYTQVAMVDIVNHMEVIVPTVLITGGHAASALNAPGSSHRNGSTTWFLPDATWTVWNLRRNNSARRMESRSLP